MGVSVEEAVAAVDVCETEFEVTLPTVGKDDPTI